MRRLKECYDFSWLTFFLNFGKDFSGGNLDNENEIGELKL